MTDETIEAPCVFATKEPPHITFATDFSEASHRAFFHALRIALAQPSQLTLLRVGPESRDAVPWHEFPGVRDTLVAWGRLPPGADKGEVGDQLGVQVAKRAMRDEDPAAGIIDFLNRHPSDLLVMATEGRPGPPVLNRASVALRVLRATRLPALLIPHAAAGFVDRRSGEVRLGRVLVPVDHEPDARHAIALATALCSALSTEPLQATALFVGEPDDAPHYLLSDTEQVSWQWQHRPGEVVATIAEQVRAEDADLVVLPTEGPQGLREHLLGSTFERLISQIGRPLLAIPADGDSG